MRTALYIIIIILAAFIVIASGSLLIGAVEPEENPSPNILMCADGRNSDHYPWTLSNTDQWPTVSDNIDIVKIYIGDLTPETDPEKVKAFVKALKAKDIKIAIEIGGLLDWHAHRGDRAAIHSFEEEYNQIKPFLELFENDPDLNFIDIIELDCPVRRMLFPHDLTADYHNVDTAIAELIKLISFWQQVLPDAEINMISNFPVWGWRDTPAYFSIDGHANGYGQYEEVILEIIEKTSAANIHLSGLTIDNPFDYAIAMAPTNQPELITDVDWMKRILELELLARHHGLNVNLIFNSERGGRNNSQLFSQHTLFFIDLYISQGGAPDGYWVQSWYEFPDRWLPENEPDTMTHLLGEVVKKIPR